MRVLFFGAPGVGHIVPQLPLAQALRDRGDEVAFVEAASVGPLLADEAMLLAARPEMPQLAAESERTTRENFLTTPSATKISAEAFAGIGVDMGYADSLDAAREWEPDLIVHEAHDGVGPIVGAALDVPVATLSVGPGPRPEIIEAVRVVSAARHAARGLTPREARWYLDTCPPSLQLDDWQAPAGHTALRPEAHTGVAVPAASAGRGRPRVLVSFGTVFVDPEVITPIARELLAQDVDIRVTLGPTATPADFDVASDRVEFADFTSLDQLFAGVDAVVTHGGSDTVLGALARGIPLVMAPMDADQPLHAGRAAAAGAGIVFPLQQFTP